MPQEKCILKYNRYTNPYWAADEVCDVLELNNYKFNLNYKTTLYQNFADIRYVQEVCGQFFNVY